MYSLSYNTEKSSNTEIHIGNYSDKIESVIDNRNYVIISCYNIYKHYPDFFTDKQYILIDSCEENKNLETISKIIESLISFNIDRNSLIIGFGGGIITDITGFIASIYMRGTQFGFIASTLLAQVDAAIGGKNGVNFGQLKNFVGNIVQPEFIICDTKLILTLNDKDFHSGLGEVLKYALIDKGDLLSFLKTNKELIFKKDINTLNEIVRKCIDIKLHYVTTDTNDTGKRHILNFGHSLGHSIEIVDSIPHGLAVLKGIIIAIELSEKFGYCSSSVLEETKELFESFGFNIDYNLTESHFEILKNDKKKSGKKITFVLLKNYGTAIIESIETNEIIKALR